MWQCEDQSNLATASEWKETDCDGKSDCSLDPWQIQGEVSSPGWFPELGFDFGIQKRLMESPTLLRFGSRLIIFPASSEIVFLFQLPQKRS